MVDDDIKVDVGVLKTQVLTLSSLCSKMDQVIEKLVDQHDRHIAKVYDDIENRRLETDADVKEIHDRIDTVLEKVQDSERRIMEEMKGFKKAMNEHSETSKLQFERLNQWKWTIAGGILVISWLISHSNLDTIVKSIH
jgi:DNA-directed RNA polymerase sigma subunit (sigma70/sigma32)